MKCLNWVKKIWLCLSTSTVLIISAAFLKKDVDFFFVDFKMKHEIPFMEFVFNSLGIESNFDKLLLIILVFWFIIFIITLLWKREQLVIILATVQNSIFMKFSYNYWNNSDTYINNSFINIERKTTIEEKYKIFIELKEMLLESCPQLSSFTFDDLKNISNINNKVELKEKILMSLNEAAINLQQIPAVNVETSNKGLWIIIGALSVAVVVLGFIVLKNQAAISDLKSDLEKVTDSSNATARTVDTLVTKIDEQNYFIIVASRVMGAKIDQVTEAEATHHKEVTVTLTYLKDKFWNAMLNQKEINVAVADKLDKISLL